MYICPEKQEKNLRKVVSITLSVADVNLFKKYARIDYEANTLTLPTVSHLLRRIVKNWVIPVKL
jgi:hypothetical protein